MLKQRINLNLSDETLKKYGVVMIVGVRIRMHVNTQVFSALLELFRDQIVN